MEQRSNVEELLRYNDKIRIKVTDRCNMHCWFCHAEGVHESKDVIINDTLSNALHDMRDVMNRAHITGGEPFMYGYLDTLLKLLSDNGYTTAVTTNGQFVLNENTMRIIERLEYINFSFHSLESKYYARLTGFQQDGTAVDRITTNIYRLNSILPVRINVVVSGDGINQKLDDMIRFASEIKCELKFVPELRTKSISTQAIDALLQRNDYRPYQIVRIVPGSNIRERYRNGTGHVIEVKKLRPYYPDCLCSGCEQRNTCNQGYSFLRIGGNPLYCQACIMKAPMDFGDFIATFWKELKYEYNNMK